jgi:hypothetical protein
MHRSKQHLAGLTSAGKATELPHLGTDAAGQKRAFGPSAPSDPLLQWLHHGS